MTQKEIEKELEEHNKMYKKFHTAFWEITEILGSTAKDLTTHLPLGDCDGFYTSDPTYSFEALLQIEKVFTIAMHDRHDTLQQLKRLTTE